jgi:inhibitor of cysteine peptidase
MNKKIITLGIAILLSLFVVSGCVKKYPQLDPATATPEAAIANPASVYCVKAGGSLGIRTTDDGSQYGICKFPDGSECEEWAFYRGECMIGFSTPSE